MSEAGFNHIMKEFFFIGLYLILTTVGAEVFDSDHGHTELKKIYRKQISPVHCKNLCRRQKQPECGKTKMAKDLCILQAKNVQKYRPLNLTCSATKPEIVCPPGFGNKYRCGVLIKDGHCIETCYKLLSHKLDWWSARLECIQRSGELVSLETPEEGAFVYRTLLNKTRDYQYYWTSGSDRVEEGTWMWTAVNLKINHMNWAKEEPNDRYGLEDYLSVFRHPETKNIEWNDHGGHATISGAICEAHGINKQDVPI